MKKTGVLLLVLAGSVFGSTLNVRVDGPSEVAVGERFLLDIVLEPVADDSVLQTGNMLIQVAGDAELMIHSQTWGEDFYDVSGDELPATMQDADGYYPSFWGPDANVSEEIVVLSFDVTLIQAGTLSVGLYPHNRTQFQHHCRETSFGHDFTLFYDGATTPWVLQNPEPATLGLLAIGGLIVLRRR